MHNSNALSLTLRTPFGVLWTRLQPRVVGGANPSARAAARAFLQPGSTSEAFSTPGSAKPPESPQTACALRKARPKSAPKLPSSPTPSPCPRSSKASPTPTTFPDRPVLAETRPSTFLCEPSRNRAKVAAPAGSMTHTAQAAISAPEAERKGGNKRAQYLR